MALTPVQKVRIGKRNAKVEALMDVYEDAYMQTLTDFKRLENFQNMYDNMAASTRWPTTAKMPIPLLFVMTERALPGAMDFLFPDRAFFRLMPAEETLSLDSVSKVERALDYTIRHRVRLRHNSFRTIKDCFKLSVGYGHIDTIVVSPPTSFIKTVSVGGRTVARTRVMGLSEARVAPRYRYVTPGQIIVTRDGTDFNGNDRVSHAFFVDFYTEQDFLDMYASQPIDGENAVLKGNPQEIIAEARSLGFRLRVPIVNLVAALGGLDLDKTNKHKTTIPVVVPVVKCYTKHHHTWIANGTSEIFGQGDRYETLRTPLLKASSHPDGMRWYPMSPVEAAQKLAIGVNLFTNAMFDLITAVVKPALAYDKTLTNNKPPERGPNGELGIAGPVRDSIRYLELPQVPQGLFSFGDMLQQLWGSAAGQETFTQTLQPGLMRAGGMAFQTALQSATGRERLANAILDTGFMEPAIEQVLMYMQSTIGDRPEVYRLREYDAKTGKEYIEEMSITEEDLVHAFELSLDLRSKHRNAALDLNARMTEFNALKDDPYTDQHELRMRFLEDEEEARRLFYPKEKAQEMQERNMELTEQERMAGIAAGQGMQQGAPAVPTPQRPEGQGVVGAGLAAAGGAI